MVLRKLTGCLSMENARNMRSTMLPCLCGFGVGDGGSRLLESPSCSVGSGSTCRDF